MSKTASPFVLWMNRFGLEVGTRTQLDFFDQSIYCVDFLKYLNDPYYIIYISPLEFSLGNGGPGHLVLIQRGISIYSIFQ